MKSLYGRFAVLVVIAVWILGLPAFTVGQEAKKFAGEKLVVATWGGDLKDARHRTVGVKIEKATGAKVEYILGNPRDNLAKLIATRGGKPPFDVFEMEEATPPGARKAGFLSVLSPERIPNLKKVPEQLFDKDKVAYILLGYGITYNTKKFKELGLPKPSRWNDLFHPKLAGHVAIPDLNVSVGPYFLVGLAIEEGGGLTNLKPAWDKLAKLKVNCYYRSSADLVTRFTSGDVWAAAWTNTRTYRLADIGFPVDFASVHLANKTGMVGYNWLGIVKGNPHQELAEMFVNVSLDPNVQYEFCKWGTMGPTNVDAQPLFAADPVLSKKVIYRLDMLSQAYLMDWDVVDANINSWIDTWNRVIIK